MASITPGGLALAAEIADGVIPVPPGLLYPDVPMSVWEGLPGVLDKQTRRMLAEMISKWSLIAPSAVSLAPPRPPKIAFARLAFAEGVKEAA